MYRSKFSYLGILFILPSILSCNSNTTTESESTTKDTATTQVAPASVRPVHWSYSEEGGPAGWGSLSPVYALCGSGRSQSPINLLVNTGKGTHDWKVEYKTTRLEISHNQHVEELINNGHTIQVTPQEGSTLSYGGRIYHLKQFHFHTPSEHTVDGKHSPMEIHMVHQSDDKSLAVIGVLVQQGSDNKDFDQLVKHLPNTPGEKKTHDSVSINVGIHVPKDLYAYHYVGSLTTPPCSENVQWLVLRTPITMSNEQLTAFSSRLKNNNRPLQPINERTLTVDDIPTKN